jgi:sortase A
MKLKFLRHRELLSLLFLAVALSFWGQATWIHAKAQLAQALIARAWNLSLAVPHEQHKPWQWADTWPVLRLQWHGDDADSEDVYVLAAADGSSLAFGPGLLSGSAQTGAGLKVIAAHRDTHFAFLEQLQTGDTISLQDATGKSQTYVVAETRIVDTRTSPLFVDASVDGLLLITCYPFRALDTGGPLRYLVQAYPAVTEASTLPALAKVYQPEKP